MPNETIVMMVGPDGVGKTTLLATMYHQLSCIDNQTDFQLVASEDTHQDLIEAYEKLGTIITQPTFTPTGSLLKGTAGLFERHFAIQFKGKKELDLVFCDIAGGVIRAHEEDKDFEEFQTKLAQATIIINVIDGSALIEGDESLSITKNEPQRIYQLLQPTLQNKPNHLVLFVITKCEAWLKNAKSQQKLENAFETQYDKVINSFETLDNNVGVLIPVKTLGCVEFTRIDCQGAEQEIIFVRKPNLSFNPENTDQPLRYALAFALRQHDQNRTLWNKWMRWLRNEELAFQNALIQFAEARQRAFKIYGNASLIEVTKE